MGMRRRSSRLFTEPDRNGWVAYFAVLLFLLAATLVRLALDPLLGTQAPFAFYFVAVVLSSWFAGLGGGLAATVLSALVAGFFFIEPRNVFGVAAASRTAGLVFVAVGAALAWQSARWRAAWQSARRSEGELTALMNAATESIWLLDRDHVLAANRTAAERMGSTVEQLRGRRWDSLMSPSIASGRDEKMAQVFATGEPVRFTDERGGMCFDHIFYPVFDGRDQVRAVAAFSRDVTEHRRAEEQLRETSVRLAHHVAQSPLAVIEFGPDMRLTQWTGAAEHIFGWTAAEVLGKRMDEFRWVFEDDVRNVDEVSADLQTGRDPLRRSSNRNYRKDGTVIWCEWYNSSLSDDQGRLRSVLSLVLDVTDRHRLERELRSQAEQLVAANRLKDEFLATLSHELRTPLNAILGWAQILSNDALPAERRQRGVAAIARNAHMQAKLVEDLLDVSRIMNASLRLTLEDVEVRGVATQALDAVRPAADAKALTLTTDIDPVLRVHADAVRLQQVIWNLLSNAVKFTPPGGDVFIGARQDGAQVEITVRDTGIGISPAFLPHVFERFRQADSSTTRAHGGLGLGLAIVRHIVELHGGSVAVSSAGEGRGATFTVCLLALRDGAATSTGGVEVRPAGGRQLAGVRVLVVDDDRDGLDVVQEILTAAEAKVACASSAEEALDLMDDFVPDALVSDLAMPTTDGYEFIRKLRASGRSLPAVALTAHGGTPERQAALRAGFDAHLVKPVIAHALVTTLTSLIR